MLKVQKKDGRQEDFDSNKIKNGIVKSGATLEQAESLSQQVVNWAQGAAVNGLIKSSEIKTKVLELLRSVNPEAADRFETYKKGV